MYSVVRTTTNDHCKPQCNVCNTAMLATHLMHLGFKGDSMAHRTAFNANINLQGCHERWAVCKRICGLADNPHHHHACFLQGHSSPAPPSDGCPLIPSVYHSMMLPRLRTPLDVDRYPLRCWHQDVTHQDPECIACHGNGPHEAI